MQASRILVFILKKCFYCCVFSTMAAGGYKKSFLKAAVSAKDGWVVS